MFVVDAAECRIEIEEQMKAMVLTQNEGAHHDLKICAFRHTSGRNTQVSVMMRLSEAVASMR